MGMGLCCSQAPPAPHSQDRLRLSSTRFPGRMTFPPQCKPGSSSGWLGSARSPAWGHWERS